MTNRRQISAGSPQIEPTKPTKPLADVPSHPRISGHLSQTEPTKPTKPDIDATRLPRISAASSRREPSKPTKPLAPGRSYLVLSTRCETVVTSLVLCKSDNTTVVVTL